MAFGLQLSLIGLVQDQVDCERIRTMYVCLANTVQVTHLF